MIISDKVLWDISGKCDEMARKNINELIDHTCKLMVKDGCFYSLNTHQLSVLYQIIIEAYIRAVKMMFESKLKFAESSIDDPELVKRAMNDPEFKKFKEEIGFE